MPLPRSSRADGVDRKCRTSTMTTLTLVAKGVMSLIFSTASSGFSYAPTACTHCIPRFPRHYISNIEHKRSVDDGPESRVIMSGLFLGRESCRSRAAASTACCDRRREGSRGKPHALDARVGNRAKVSTGCQALPPGCHGGQSCFKLGRLCRCWARRRGTYINRHADCNLAS